MLDALGRALRLSEDERAYLRCLARPQPCPRRRPQAERVRRADVLAWNRPAHGSSSEDALRLLSDLSREKTAEPDHHPRAVAAVEGTPNERRAA